MRVRRPVVQVVTAGAGAVLHGDRLEGVERQAPAFHFLEIAADVRRMRCRAVALDGRVLDVFEVPAGDEPPGRADGGRGREASVS